MKVQRDILWRDASHHRLQQLANLSGMRDPNGVADGYLMRSKFFQRDGEFHHAIDRNVALEGTSERGRQVRTDARAGGARACGDRSIVSQRFLDRLVDIAAAE